MRGPLPLAFLIRKQAHQLRAGRGSGGSSADWRTLALIRAGSVDALIIATLQFCLYAGKDCPHGRGIGAALSCENA